ncbi:MAG: acyl-CoA thioesterase [Hyphomicrobiaceae bacterium]|jgi:acyl-CoA thioesterase
MDTRFNRDTAVERIDDTTWRARIDKGWWIIAGPNGGYIGAIILRAMQGTIADRTRAARSLTVHFTAPPVEGQVQIFTKVERKGGRLSSVSARMEQDDRTIAVALGAFSSAREESISFEHVSMPEVPAAEKFSVSTQSPSPAIPMHGRYEFRPCIGGQPFSKSSDGVTGGWIRLEEPQAVDACVAAALADAWPPAVFPLLDANGPAIAVPTIDLTVHFRETLPAADVGPDDFLLVQFQSRVARNGFVEEDGTIWSADGRLLVQSRQLAVLV